MSKKPFLRRGLALSSFSLTLGLLALAGPSCGPVVTAGDCPDGFTDCDGICANLEASPNHCGACDNACEDGAACAHGACEGSAACPPGLIDCGGACVDPSVHPSHCGACFNACPPDAVCAAGACVDDGCAPGLTDCFGFCTDIFYDPNNCGLCGLSCGPNAVCDGGVCTTAGCPPGLVDCFGFCTDIFYDPNNCGGCGLSCGPNAACDGGVCVSQQCPPGLTDCGGLCVDLAWSPEHCGACFASCGPDETCSGGACVGCSGSGAVDEDLGSTVPQTITGSTAGAGDDAAPACGPPGGQDVAFSFTAPAGGDYTFDTFGSSFDTVLHLPSGVGCSGDSLACNDDSAGTLQSQITLALGAGQTVVVVVDGFGPSAGNFTLHIHAN